MRAGIIIYNPLSGKILLIHRWKEGREYFVLPGGTIESGETPLEAASREIQEELGYCLPASQLQPAFSFTNCGREEHYFLAHVTDSQTPAISGEERARSSETNVYQPVWVYPSDLPLLSLQPALLQSQLPDFLDPGQSLKN